MTSRDDLRRQVNMQIAEFYSTLSHAKRLKVGAVLVKDDRIISGGYNGTPSGYDNTCEEEYKYKKAVMTSRINALTYMPMYQDKEYTELRTKLQVVHAETNVIAFAAKHGVSTNQCTMYITHSPCFECSKLIIQAGIKEVVYKHEYRIRDGIKFLMDCGVNIKQSIGEASGPTKNS